jgi:hypothetical protein
MAATFTKYALEAMGFKDTVQKGDISASFMSITAYEARGIVLPAGFSAARRAKVAGAEYRVALSKSVNAACQSLIGDNFADNEGEWRKEVKSQGPFALIAVGPTDFISCDAGRMMRESDGSITTYDSFLGLRETLKALEERVLPPVIATLTLAFNEPDQYVVLRKLVRASAGRTPDGTLVKDVRVDIHSHAYVSRAVSEQRTDEVLDASVSRAPKLNERAARSFALGTAETDNLKKFLFFFLSLEIETHAAFRRISHAKQFRAQLMRDETGLLRQSTFDLISRDIAQWTKLLDRFIWCANCCWSRVEESDIAVFKELKKARDDIAHGNTSEPPAGFARKAELLAHKVLWG